MACTVHGQLRVSSVGPDRRVAHIALQISIQPWHTSTVMPSELNSSSTPSSASGMQCLDVFLLDTSLNRSSCACILVNHARAQQHCVFGMCSPAALVL